MKKTYTTALPENFGGLPPESSSYGSSRAVILPVPLERTTTYMTGTRNGPGAILAASRNMELYDEEFGCEPHERFGIATLAAVDTQEGTLDHVMAELRATERALLADGKWPVVLGGEHSLTSPLVAAALEKYPDLSVLQIDAHADLRAAYQGNPVSHASVMRRVVEMCRAVQVGIRSLSAEEAEAMPRLPTRVYWAREIAHQPVEVWGPSVVGDLSEHVYLTVDLDGFDPAFVPATGTPEPGGLDWRQVTGLVRAVAAKRAIVGADVVELLPQPGDHASDFLAAKLVYKILAYVLLTGREVPRAG
ncbi:MAG TPA: agmatinase [Candidatus Acidoferrales bacterium]|nr:agmatinase [Candidatus Acidoferrales bacterium]